MMITTTATTAATTTATTATTATNITMIILVLFFGASLCEAVSDEVVIWATNSINATLEKIWVQVSPVLGTRFLQMTCVPTIIGFFWPNLAAAWGRIASWATTPSRWCCGCCRPFKATIRVFEKLFAFFRVPEPKLHSMAERIAMLENEIERAAARWNGTRRKVAPVATHLSD